MSAHATPHSPSAVKAAILAGGASHRMGRPKALIDFEGETLIARTSRAVGAVFSETIVLTSEPTFAAAAKLTALADIFPGKGPLAGIHAALRYFNAPVFCCACDMPYLNTDFIRYMLERYQGQEALAPRIGGFYEPLHAIYNVSCLPLFERELQQERPRSMQKLLAELETGIVDENETRRFDSALQMFENWNRPEEMAHNGSIRNV